MLFQLVFLSCCDFTLVAGVQIESALSDKVKRTINTQDTIRVLRNCHEDLPEDELNEILSDNMKKLQNNTEEKF